MSGLENKTLFVAIDDSNNGESPLYRIFNAIFSNSRSDFEEVSYEPDIQAREVYNWLHDRKIYHRGFRFAMSCDEELNHMQPHLPLFLPNLILSYAPSVSPSPTRVEIAVDGPVTSKQDSDLKRRLGKYFREGVEIFPIVKHRKKMASKPRDKRYESPHMLHVAHSRAKHIFKNLSTYASKEEAVKVDVEKIKDTFLKILSG